MLSPTIHSPAPMAARSRWSGWPTATGYCSSPATACTSSPSAPAPGRGSCPAAAVRTGQVAAAAQLAAAGLGPTLLGSHAVPAGLDAALMRVRPRLVREVVAFTRSAWSPGAEQFLELVGKLPMRSRPRGAELVG